MVDKIEAVVNDSDVLTPLAPFKSGFLKLMPPVIQELARRGGAFSLTNEGKLVVEGFYKNGPMELTMRDDDLLIAEDKRGRNVKIGSFDDLLALNYEWWRVACSKKQYVAPERPWLDGFLEKGWVGRQTIYVPKDGTAPSTSWLDEKMAE